MRTLKTTGSVPALWTCGSLDSAANEPLNTAESTARMNPNNAIVLVLAAWCGGVLQRASWSQMLRVVL